MTISNFFRTFAEIFASQGAPQVSTTPVLTSVANFSTIFASIVDTGGKFATCFNDTTGKFATGINNAGGKLPNCQLSLTLAANLPPVQTTLVANNGNNYQIADNLK
jgi:hypothetical protein